MAFFKTDDSFTYSISRGYIGGYKHILANYNNFYFPTDEDAKAFNDTVVGYGSCFEHAGLYVHSDGSYQVHAAEIIEKNEEKIYALEKENEKSDYIQQDYVFRNKITKTKEQYISEDKSCHAQVKDGAA